MTQVSHSIESRAGWIVAIASAIIMGIGFGVPYVVVVALKSIAAEAGSRSVPSLTNALAYFGAGAGGIVFGWIADRIGVMAPALFGAVMVGAGAIVASGGSEWQLYLGHGLMIGLLGNAAMFAPLMANVSRWFDRNRGAALALVATGQQLAGAIWPPLFRYTTDTIGWRDTLFWAGVVALATMVPLSLLLRRPPATMVAAQNAAEPVRDGKVLGWPANLVQALISLAIVCCCVAMAMPMSHVVAFCSDLGFSAARGAEMLSLLLFCAFLSRMFWGRLSDRVGGLTTVLICSAAQATFLALYLPTDSLLGLYFVSAAFGLGFGGIVPSFLLSIRELFAEREAGWRMGAVVFGGLLGMALGSWLGGYVYDLTASYQPAFLAGVLFNLVNLVLVGTLLLRGAGRTRLTPSLAASR